MKHGSLFSGIGGFDYASKLMGWENIFHCEWMEFPRKVLEYHFPESDSYIDICKTDFKKYANKIDILTGGFPCQPFSLAGKRKGTDDERYLWGEMLRAIQEIKPKFVIAENVFGITNIDGGLVFEQVCLDLENEGYEVQPFIIPACSKNAPHRRDRVWFVAQNPLFSRCVHGESNQERAEVRKFGDTCTGSADGIHLSKGDATNTNGIGCGRRSEQSKSNQSKEWKICENEQQHRDGIRCKIEGCSWDATHTKCEGLEGHNWERNRCPFNWSNKGLLFGSKVKFIFANPDLPRCKRQREQSISSRQIRVSGNGWKSNATNTNDNGFKTLYNKECKLGQESRSKTFGRNIVESIYSRKRNWENFPTQSPICSGDDGLPTQLDGITFSKWRAESIKGYGNAIVPQVALELFKVIESINNEF